MAGWTPADDVRPFIDAASLLNCEITRVGRFDANPAPGACNRVYRTAQVPNGIPPPPTSVQ